MKPYNDIDLLLISAAKNEKSKLIDSISQNPNVIYYANEDGDTILHIVAKFKYKDTLYELIKHASNINMINDNNQPFYYQLYDDNNLIKVLYKYHKKNLSSESLSRYLILPNIYKSKIKNDIYYANVIELLKFNINYNEPKDFPMLIYSLFRKKNHIATLLLEIGASVNVYDKNYNSPLIHAISNKEYNMAKILIDNYNADINYAGLNNNHNILIMALNDNEYVFAMYLLDKNIDVNIVDEYKNNVIMFFIEKDIPSDIFIKILLKSNLDNVNIDGNTPLHVMAKFNKWQNYNTILQKLKFNHLILNDDNKLAIDYVSDMDKNMFIEMISASLYNSKKCEDNCRTMTLLRPKNKHIKKMHQYGTFIPTFFNYGIYITYLLLKYENLGIPFQYYVPDIEINDKQAFKMNMLDYGNNFNIEEYVNALFNYEYHLLPHHIIYFNENLFYIHPRFEFCINKCLQSDKIDYVIIKLTICGENINHANIIIYDKRKKVLEYFEPYGFFGISYRENTMDEFIKNNICRFFNVKTYDCYDYYKNIGFQTFSEDFSKTHVIGDPGGYCLAWCYFYLEQRINNPKLSMKEIIDNNIKKIIEESYDPTYNCFLDFIRGYTYKYHKDKTEIFNIFQIPQKYVTVNALPTKIMRYISEKLYTMFLQTIVNRYFS